jgi:hypothetical protein
VVILRYYSKGADVLHELLGTPPNRSKEVFEGKEDENGNDVLGLMHGLFDELTRAATVHEFASVVDFLAGILR